ncbi:hypothetical protein F4604DRAFT_1927298 [Suillus subluteus]|nr:hypothetical protein F4604DRAFT_1927298 [Suillus subluteus]
MRAITRIIDVNCPVLEGLADTIMIPRLTFDSPEARQPNLQTFETIYHTGLEASCEEAERDGPYKTFRDSPADLGQLYLKEKIAQTRLQNSLFFAPMPTASTSQIFGFNECFEPYTSNIYTRCVLAAEFQGPRRLWVIIAHNGSIVNILSIPNDIKAVYKAIWGIPQKKVIDLAADRGASEFEHSLAVAYHRLTDEYALLWLEEGLKTGMYYLRTHPALHVVQFTINQNVLKAAKANRANLMELPLAFLPLPLLHPLLAEFLHHLI